MIWLRPGFAAETDWSLCHVPSFEFIAPQGLEPGETRIEAQTIASENNESIRLTGNVMLTREQQRIEADDMLIIKSSEQITATGNVRFYDPDQRIAGPSLRVDNIADQAQFEQPKFQLLQQHARGQAESIEKLDEYRSRYSELEYTSCDPDKRTWKLRASELEIDRESGRGEATHTTLYVQDVPFLYLPYFQFPVDDRRMSGILTPEVGYSDTTGGSVILPVYWNQAPNYDMTITPAWFDRLGLQLTTENRYLFTRHQGELDLSYLDDRDYGEARWFQQWRHATTLPFDVRAGLLLAEVSDDDFFEDFGTVAPEYNDIAHLQRYLRLNREGESWQSELLWQDYQTLDETTAPENRPYSSLPRFSFDAQPEAWQGQLLLPTQFEWVSFDRDDSVTGARTHLVQSVRWNNRNSWYFLEPDLQLAFTDYRLDNNPGGDSQNRALPTLGIDSGLIFERDAGDLGKWRQTLEPRLYFLYTPFEDQDDIPNFDTSVVANTYSNLFRNNRFTGSDRIGDASQVTVGLTSRLFDKDSGRELLNARAGQIYYFEDRRVSLDGTRDTETRSDLIAELDFLPSPALTLTTRLVYDPDDSNIYDRDFSVNYAENGYAGNLAYYFTEDELEQALASIAYPINPRWQMVAKLHHSLRFDETVENLLGFSYESCCWGLKILAGQIGDKDTDYAEIDNSIFVEFTFKGLGQAGQNIDTQLQRSIPGYRPAF